MVQNIAIKLTKKYFEERIQNTILKKLNKLLESTKKTTKSAKQYMKSEKFNRDRNHTLTHTRKEQKFWKCRIQ